MCKFLTCLCWLIISAVPVLAQERLYPVRENKDTTILMTPDRNGLVVEKSFQHKLTLSYPTGDQLDILPDTNAPILVLWMRIQNTSPRPFDVNTSKFTATDEQGKMYSALTQEEATNRMFAAPSGGSIGTRTLRSISLGRAGGKRTEEQFKEDILRYSMKSAPLAAGAVKEGLIFFEAPARKKFTVSIVLGDVWSRPLVFSTEKTK